MLCTPVSLRVLPLLSSSPTPPPRQGRLWQQLHHRRQQVGGTKHGGGCGGLHVQVAHHALCLHYAWAAQPRKSGEWPLPHLLHRAGAATWHVGHISLLTSCNQPKMKNTWVIRGNSPLFDVWISPTSHPYSHPVVHHYLRIVLFFLFIVLLLFIMLVLCVITSLPVYFPLLPPSPPPLGSVLRHPPAGAVHQGGPWQCVSPGGTECSSRQCRESHCHQETRREGGEQAGRNQKVAFRVLAFAMIFFFLFLKAVQSEAHLWAWAVPPSLQLVH